MAGGTGRGGKARKLQFCDVLNPHRVMSAGANFCTICRTPIWKFLTKMRIPCRIVEEIGLQGPPGLSDLLL